jgi:ketol-acid reductoisomerase
MYFDRDVTMDAMRGVRIAVVGYGNQGRAQALNLRDSEMNVVIALRDGSKSIHRAEEDGFSCIDIPAAARECDLLSILIPDQVMAEVYDTKISRYLKPGKMLLFSHGYNIHYKEIQPPPFVDVAMVAPSGPGYAVREEFKNGSGVPTLLAVMQNVTGRARDIALSYSKAIGGTRSCCFLSTFKEETETDLFGEQIILTGLLPRIIDESFKVLLEAGYSSTVAWFVSFYEVKQIADLVSKVGIEDFYKAVSETAEYGGMRQSSRLISSDFKNEMQSALSYIQSGDFHRNWKEEASSGYPELSKMRASQSDSPLNEITKKMLEILKKNKDES